MICEKTPYRLQLAPHLTGCPAPWIKFVYKFNPDGYSPGNLSTVLRSTYNAHFSNHVVTFESHEDYMMFLMNWS